LISVDFNKYRQILNNSDFIEYSGKISKVVGLTIESDGPEVNIGEICQIKASRSKNKISAEVVGSGITKYF
jgi:flagellum-specific ATP synthase